MHKDNRVMVLLNSYVRIYGSIDFVSILKQLLKEFVDLGQYPPDIKPHNEIADEVHRYLNENNLYGRIDDDKHEYRLYVGYWKTPLSLATYNTGNGVNVLVPDSQWFIARIPKEVAVKGRNKSVTVVDDLGGLPYFGKHEGHSFVIDLNVMWEMDRDGTKNILSNINDSLIEARQNGNKAIAKQATDYSSEIVMGFIKDNFFDLLPYRKYMLYFGGLDVRPTFSGVNIHREGDGWWITVTDN